MSVRGLHPDHEVAVAMMAHERLGSSSPLQAQGMHPSFDAILRAVCDAASSCAVSRKKVGELCFLDQHTRMDAWNGLLLPLSVVVDNHGDGVFVLDGARPSVKVFDRRTGRLVREFGYGELSQVGCIGMREGGEILVSNNKNIVMFHRGGFPMERFTFRVPGEETNVRCSSFAVDVEDNFVLGEFDKHRVVLFDREQRVMRVFSSFHLGLRFPYLVAITEEGNILVAHRGEEPLLVLSKYGQVVESLCAGGERVEAEGIAVDGSNRIVVVERRRRRIVTFASTLRLVGSIDLEGTPSLLAASPSCLAADGAGNLLIGDRNNRAIHVLPSREVTKLMSRTVRKQTN
uniref:Uncharacterized protein n=1 Tax=Guillardia theta TaxID=55529 RepID=A0A7S4NRA9_GUITH|mmetsp:Transcript_30776/g.98992  ORF Transcript_30776/g.98992 Transcript_30776/m.98992 type:complete len:345 (+) Transcript_30776:238-1272(+)